MIINSVLFVHQSAEMYGSDRVLLSLVLGMKAGGFYPIVLLPENGPLMSVLLNEEIETHIVSVTKVDRKTLSFKGLLSLPSNLISSIRSIDRVLAGRRIVIVYSNTLAVLGAAVWAKVHQIPHLWHVHELLLSPSVIRRGFPWLLRLLADRVVCNSMMTAEWVLREQPMLVERTSVIWNGLGTRPQIKANDAAAIRAELGLTDGQLLVTLVGRINRWKGQCLLIQAATILWDRGYHDVHYLVVGSPPSGMEFLVDNLKLQIAESAAHDQVHIMEFMDDVWSVWDACDIAVVPSTEPEPFGMVAIEAMAATKPVVVAAHGGLLDIIEHEVSGLLFKPCDAMSFADELEKLIVSSELRHRLAVAGCDRQEKIFSLDGQLKGTLKLLNNMIGITV